MLGKNTQFLTIFICKKSTIGDINNFFANIKIFFAKLLKIYFAVYKNGWKEHKF